MEKSNDFDVEAVKKKYETKETTNEKGERRLVIVIDQVRLPKEFIGKNVYVHRDYENQTYYLVHSHKLGMDEKVRKERQLKRKKANDELKAHKTAIKRKIQILKADIRGLVAEGKFIKADDTNKEILALQAKYKELPKRAKI